MAKTKIIGGKKYNLTLSGNVSGRKATAEKTAERMRKAGYSARILKEKRVSGRGKDSKGRTILKTYSTRYNVYIRKK